MSSGTEEEFTEFVSVRSPSLFRIAMALTGHRQQAEDLLQTVLAKAYRSWSRIDGNPEAYVRVALYRQQVSWWRQRARRREVSTAHLPDRPTTDHAVERVDLGLALRDALRGLAPKYRAVLVLRYLEDLPDDEIARILGCRPSTVRSQATRALSRLRERLPDEGTALPDQLPYPRIQEAHS